MNRRIQYAKMIKYLASRNVGRDLPKRYAANLDPSEEYEFEDMTSTELEAYASALSQLTQNAHEAMDMALMYREMAFLNNMLKASHTSKEDTNAV